MFFSKSIPTPDATEQKADSVANSTAEQILTEINRALVATTLSQRQEFFHRLADDASKTSSHKLPGLEIDDPTKTHPLTIRDTTSGDVVYGETQMNDKRRQIFEMQGHGRETTTTLSPEGQVEGSVERHRYTDTNITIGQEDTFRNAAGEVTGSVRNITMVGGERISSSMDAQGNYISQTIRGTDGSERTSNMPSDAMTLGKAVDQSTRFDAFLEKIKKRQSR